MTYSGNENACRGILRFFRLLPPCSLFYPLLETRQKFSALGNGKLADNDIVCLLRGSVGKTAVFKADEFHKTGFICAQMLIIRCFETQMRDYMSRFLGSQYYMAYIQDKTTGTAVRQLPAREVAKMPIPLPPLAEQRRIVARLEKLFPLCQRLS